MNEPSNKAVFLSYASQDAEAARRICEALRAAGIEVWFDQSELVGGDAWDAKIRGQIASCALFVPVISAATQARREGYFRLEWKLAAQRTHMMSERTAFLLPVVIDATGDKEADVPSEFRAVQWTRLPGGETPPAFGERVKKLLGGGDPVGAALRRDSSEPSRREAAPTRRPARSWPLPAVIALAAIVALAIWRPWKEAARTTPANTTDATRAGEKPSAPLSETQRLVAKAWEQLNRPDLDRGELEIAADFCKRATTLSPDDADAWAAWSQVESWYIYGGLDPTTERKESARTKAARALKLAPKSFEARLAEICYLVRGLDRGDRPAQFSSAVEKTLRELLGERPNEPRACFALGILLRSAGRLDEAYASFDRMAETAAFAATANSEKGWVQWGHGNFRAAQVACDRSLAVQPFAGNLLLQIFLALSWTGDLELARATVERAPPTLLQEDALASYAARVYWWRREPNQMLRVLNAVHRPWLTFTNCPKDYLVGHAQRMAGSEPAAQISWREAARQVDLRMEKEPASVMLHWWKAELLGLLGRAEESKAASRRAQELGGQSSPSTFSSVGDWSPALAVGDQDEAVRSLEKSFANKTKVTTAAILRLNPQFDPLRSDPRFQALLARAEADPQRSPQAKGSLTASEAPLAAPAKADPKSVAVLPFENLSSEQENAFFADGVHEDVITNLAKIRALKVIARPSVLAFRDPATRNLKKIAEELAVATLLTGSVRRAGKQVLVTVQLIDPASGTHLWGDRYQEDLTDLFAIQTGLAEKITQALKTNLTRDERALIARRPTENAAAFEFYLRAMVLNRGDYVGKRFEEMIALLENAVALDRNFAEAHAALATAHTNLFWFGHLDPTPRRAELARSALAAAIRLAPELAETRFAAGVFRYRVDLQWQAAIAEFNRAREGRPNDATLIAWLGFSHRRLGNWHEAVKYFAESVVLDPRSPDPQVAHVETLLEMRRYPEAEQFARRYLAIAPGTPRLEWFAALSAWELEGDSDRARQRVLRALERAYPENLPRASWAALLARDYVAADHALVQSGLTSVVDIMTVLNEPVALHRSRLAFLRGDAETARQFADQALEAYASGKWTRRQEPRVLLGQALAHALAGRSNDALAILRQSRTVAVQIDVAEGAHQQFEAGAVYVVLGRNDEAIGLLRGMMSGYCRASPQIVRHDPIWSRLNKDPRFEEILRSAKPL